MFVVVVSAAGVGADGAGGAGAEGADVAVAVCGVDFNRFSNVASC